MITSERATELARENYDDIFRFCLSCLGDEWEAADAAQEVFLLLRQRLGELEDCNLRGWLFAVADKKIKEARLNASRRKRELILEDIAESLRSESGELYPACELTRPLGEKDRELFEMIYEQGMSHSDISRALGVSDGALRVRICRLKVKLMKNIN